jgi:hypothetical protein
MGFLRVFVLIVVAWVATALLLYYSKKKCPSLPVLIATGVASVHYNFVAGILVAKRGLSNSG